ncbi:MAG: PAS domain-containing sensor histidine kinase [Ignavibacteria bacterium]|nr:MAG: PAS domain-containing sensor histidine kinase [Ignavibacteria bacterium]
MIEEKINILSLDARLLLEMLIKILPFPAYIKNSEGKYIICNEKFSDSIFGISPSEIINHSIEDFSFMLSKEEINYYSGLDNKLLNEGGVAQLDAELLCADGTVHYFHEIKAAFEIDADNAGIIGIMIDLTESRQIKQAFIDQEKYLKIFLDYVPDAICFKDKEGKYLKVNSAELIKLGVKNEKEVLGKNVGDLFDKNYANKIIKEEKEIIEKGIIYQKEEIYKYNDGKDRWLHITKVPYPDSEGNIAGLFGISRDITEKKKNEENLNFQLEFEKTLSMISHHIMKTGTKNFKSGLFYAAKKLNEFFDSSIIHFFLGTNTVIQHEVSIDKNNNEIELPLRRQHEFLNKLKGKSSQINNLVVNEGYFIEEISFNNHLVHNLYLPLNRDKKESGAIIIEQINKDITLIEKNSSLVLILAELLQNAYDLFLIESQRDEMQKQMHKMVTAVEQSANIVMILDLKGRIEYVNNRIEEILGFPKEEFIGKNPRELIVSGDDTTNIREMAKSIINGEKWSGTFLVKDKNDENVWLNIVLSPIFTEDKISNYLAIMEDVTEKINTANQKAVSQKLEAIGQLAAGIAHEINTPMQFIGDNTSFLKDSFNSINELIDKIDRELQKHTDIQERIDEYKNEIDYDFLKAEIPEAIDQNIEGIKRVSKIVKAMKEFSHPGNHEKSYNDLNKAVENTVLISKNEWKYCAEINLQLDQNLPQIYCEVDSINQVLLNMIVNAAHAIEEKLKNKIDERGEIKISTKLISENRVKISIQDNGIGMTEETKNKIFEPFFTTKEIGRGTGQGLTIAYDLIVKKHNGEIRVDSEYGRGTTFDIFLPVNDGEQQ